MNRVTKMPPQLCGGTSVANTHECQVRRAKRSRNRGSYADDLIDFAILWRPWNAPLPRTSSSPSACRRGRITTDCDQL